jgi:hypothetical protein
VEVCPNDAINLEGADVLVTYLREDLILDGSPPGEDVVGPPPRRLYRMAIGLKGQEGVEPAELLARRMRHLLRE